jgi:hypothetical protein
MCLLGFKRVTPKSHADKNTLTTRLFLLLFLSPKCIKVHIFPLTLRCSTFGTFINITTDAKPLVGLKKPLLARSHWAPFGSATRLDLEFTSSSRCPGLRNGKLPRAKEWKIMYAEEAKKVTVLNRCDKLK